MSLDAQIDACREYGEGLGLLLDATCVKKEALHKHHYRPAPTSASYCAICRHTTFATS